MKSLHIKEFFRKLHHKKWIRFVMYSFINLALPVVGSYAHFIEPYWVKISRYKVPIKNLPKNFDDFRIVHLSDLHFGPTNRSTRFFKRCIQKINQLKPDLVVLTGDFFQWDPQYIPKLAALLSSMTSQHGVFASLGNHDYGVCHKNAPPTDPFNYLEVIDTFLKHGIRTLHNEATTLKKGKDKINLVGLGDYWTSHFKPQEVFKKSSFTSSSPTILLSHNPDSIYYLLDYEFDLMLAGHAHGGQISFPFIGPLAMPIKHRHLRRGLLRIKDRWLYSNRGLGFIFKARFGSKPEIACLELVSTGDDN